MTSLPEIGLSSSRYTSKKQHKKASTSPLSSGSLQRLLNNAWAHKQGKFDQNIKLAIAIISGPCRSYEHQCSNGRCIMNELVCNGHNPCGDFSDCPVTEPPQEVKTTRESDDVMMIALASSLASVLAIIVCSVVLFKCYRLRQKHEVWAQI